MAKLIEIDWSPDVRTLRQFGWIALGGFGLLAGLAWFEMLIFSIGLGEARPIVVGTFLALGAWGALGSLIAPKLVWPLYAGLTVIAFPIGFVLSHVIMVTLFFLIITPIGIVMRLFGHDPMLRSFEPEAATYWVDCRPERPRESYFKQY